MKKTSIDVLIPYYSNISYLEQAITSVLKQNFRDFRLVIVDDFSPDHNVPNLLKRFNDPRIEYHRNTKNLGLARNFQKCLSLVKSEWFVMLGEDDLLLPNYLTEMLRSAISQQGCALVHPRVEIINSEGVLILPIADLVKRLIFGTMQISHSFRHLRRKSERYYNGQDVIPWVLLGNFFYFPTIFWNSKIVKSIGFSESYQIVLDLDLLLQITAQNKKIVFTDLTLAQYRRHARSISNNPLNMIPRLEEERLLSHQFAKQSGVGVFNSFLSILRLTSRFHALTLWISSFVRLRLPTAIKFFIAALRY